MGRIDQVDPLSVHSGGTEVMVPKDFRWPGGKRIAVIFRMAFEAWSDDHWPGLSPMGNPLKPGFPDLNARGWAEYGYRCGIFRGLEVFARQRITGTFMVNGLLAEEGFQWHGDTLNDDLPYLVRFGSHSIVAIPGTMDVNDLPLYMKHGQPPGVYVENFEQWLRYVRKVLKS